jgi:transglutaminase-like putative cysteine protease
MTRSTRRTLAAGVATAMALAALFPVFQGGHWFWRVLGAVAAVTLAGLLTRAVRLPALLQPLVALLFLVAYLCLVFAHGTLDHGLPTQRTIDALRALVDRGQADIDKYGPPIVPSPGVVLMTAAGVGAVAFLVDLLAVVLDRVALSGLPLLALFAVPSAVLPGGLGGLAFAIGATGWLVLLLEEGSERVGRWGTPMRSALPGARAGGDDSSLGRVGRRIGAAALGLAVVVPAAVPGLDHRLIDGNGGGKSSAGDGPSSATTYNPLTTLKDQLTLPSPRQLFVYSTDDPQPDYVRMTTLDRYNGLGWSSSKLEADRDGARVQKGVPRPAGEDGNGPHQAVTMRVAVDGDHLEVHWLPLPYGPRKVDVDGTWLWDPGSQTVFSASRTTRNLKPYTVTASRPVPTRESLLAATGVENNFDVAARYGSALRVSQSVVDLAQRITRGADTPYDEAVAIQRWFTNPRNGYVYDVNASLPSRGQDALEAFLQGKHGFCEQYATAMAVLLRVVGLPSRVAVGFTPGQAVPGHKGVYSVTTSDAHAWPEAWFPGTGWVRFEPTPAANGATTPDYTLAPTLGGPSNTPSVRPTPKASANAFPRGLKDPDTLLRPPGSGTPLTAASRHLGRWATGALLVLLLAMAPWVTTRLRRRSRLHRLDQHGDPLVAWAQLHDDVTDVGAPWRAPDSPRAAARRLTALVDQPGRAALDRLAAAAELTRYAPPGRANSEGLAADTVAVRRALRASAPRIVRWRAAVWPPSTLQWLAHLLSELVADVLDGTDRVLSVVFRPARWALRLR